MTENPGGTPPRDDEPDAAAAPPPPEPPRPPAPDEPEVPGAVPPGGAVPPPEPAAPPVAPPPPAQAPPVYPPAGGQYPPAGGAYPPPAGGYPPPASGGYPPPPPAGGYASPGYGAPGTSQYPPPPPGQYGPPAGGYPPPSAATPLGEALSYGWNKFTQNGGTFIGAGLLWILGAGVIGFLLSLIFGGFASLFDDGRGYGGFNLGWIVLVALWSLLGFVVEAVFIRAALRVTYGRPISLKDFFDFSDLGPVVLAALLLAAINLVVGLVSWIPLIGWLIAVAVNFFLFFTLFFVIDKKLQPTDATRASVDLIRANLGATVLFVIVSYLIVVAGFVLCFVGAFVAVPVVLLASAYFYRRLLGEPIAP